MALKEDFLSTKACSQASKDNSRMSLGTMGQLVKYVQEENWSPLPPPPPKKKKKKEKKRKGKGKKLRNDHTSGELTMTDLPTKCVASKPQPT